MSRIVTLLICPEMYAMAKIANLAKNRQTADENLNEVIKVLLTKWRG